MELCLESVCPILVGTEVLIRYAGRLGGSRVRSDSLRVMSEGDCGGWNEVVRPAGKRFRFDLPLK